MNYALYCSLCWQEFDHPAEHDAASSYKGERLNGHCRGDIHRQERGGAGTRGKTEKGPALPESGEPLVIR